MDDDQKQQLREDLEFALMKVERSTILDIRAAQSSNRNPMEIKNLQDVFSLFGYSAEDFIDRHDQCTMFKRVRGELEDLLRDTSTSTKKYDKAILLRDRLRLIKRQFIDSQGKYERSRQDHEQNQFKKGTVFSKQRCEQRCASREAKTEDEIVFKKLDLLKTHTVEREQLESFLSRIPEPHVKFSTLLLELKNTEKNLSRLRLFEDAKNVYVKADAMEAEERESNKARFEKFKESKRSLLYQRHQDKLAELEEKLMEKRYILMRSNDQSRNIESQRVRNLHRDMRHAHAMDIHDKKFFSTDPTPAVRKHHSATASMYRGQQLLSTVQGKRLEVASLCGVHDEENGRVPHCAVVYLD